ncbi:L-lactate dehydrogenase complex protein LldG [Nakamurella sp. UYEF19]|uniref:LutC/YkgG family protein n=1 Tax=Nakamurella sp. UYEF19 TaxID=1756392 RepID=UPI003396FAFC
MSSRDTMLRRIRTAVAKGAPSEPPPPVPREYHRSGEHAAGSDHVVELVIDRLLDYKAEVTVVERAGLAAAVDIALGSASSVVVPPGVAEDVRSGCHTGGRTVVVDTDPATLSATELDAVDAVVVGSTVAIAVTGTIVLSGRPDEGRRAISLVPDLLVVVLPVDRIVETVPDGLALLTPTAPLTMISGPSATSDIELSRVEGVHGPRTLRVVIVR